MSAVAGRVAFVAGRAFFGLPARQANVSRRCASVTRAMVSTTASGGAADTPQSSVEVTREMVVKTAQLAQLELSDAEIDRITPEFRKIIGFVEQMNALDLDNVEPMSRVDEVTNVLREDVPDSFEDPDALLAEMPDTESDFLRVPRILAEDNS